MKLSYLRVLLASFLLLGNGLTGAQASPKLPQACVMCGTRCCCPEICDPKLDQLKKTLGYCSTGENSARMLRGKPSSSCRLTDTPPLTTVQSEARHLMPRPVFTALGQREADPGEKKFLLADDNPILFLPPDFDIPTPPPRLLA